ncbi:hypothetical protein CVT25_014279 [Psilocybe cyanescens]|uniref:Uncharacterized protein n=1 Tax=Psilocybe cyanescens TaxID=93625 RepID=A0A409WUF9_PSICY|nr:hypothetical protein CVT25_014279 [Psilocybe cyanescens]
MGSPLSTNQPSSSASANWKVRVAALEAQVARREAVLEGRVCLRGMCAGEREVQKETRKGDGDGQ